MKDAIKEVFFDDLGGKAYLRRIAKNDEALFISLLAKLIPAEIRTEITVQNRGIDLGLAMADAAKNLALVYSAPAPALFTDAQVIDHAPTLVTASGANDV